MAPGGNKENTWWERWERCMMGLRISPYVTIKQTHLAFEVANGNRLDPHNALRWSKTSLNLPGDPNYTPQLPWVYRSREDGKMAGCTPSYVDDLRPVGCNEEECWAVLHQTASRLGYLGLQNASRKTRPPSQEPGAWAGTIAYTGNRGVGVKCSQEKWDKAKDYLSSINTELNQQASLNHKRLESMRGFFIHLQRTYPTITPFLKGIHLTLDGWRPNRDHEMWKINVPMDSIWDGDEEAWVALQDTNNTIPPARVQPAPRLKQDLKSLSHLFHSTAPPLRYLRPSSMTVCMYGFVDASGAGFGSSISRASGNILFCQGLWGRDADNMSSNFRELGNLVESLEDGIIRGELKDSEVFLFTDNSTAEGAYYNGNSSSKLLFNYILRLRQIDLHGGIKLHIVHVAGTRMIAQGTDALSRGMYTEGILAGRATLDYIPCICPPISGQTV